MLTNADFSRRAVVTPQQYQWIASPKGGIERVMLDRVGAEKARATNIVRYAPNSYFPRHVHSRGEEILVLSGTFSEGDGHFPAGWYLRNPPRSSHQPFSEKGAVIFVKLRQMSLQEKSCVRINTCDPVAWRRKGGREVCPLFSDEFEQVCLQRLSPHEVLFAEPVKGVELLVLDGNVTTEDQTYRIGSWMRLPAGDLAWIAAGAQGTTLYHKTGHLPDVEVEA